MIPREIYAGMISTLDWGGSTAEKDHLLEHARIETAVFSELFLDRIDLVRGCKGSGKTALFTFFSKHLRKEFLSDQRTIIVNGAEEPNGDPIFQAFFPRFEQLSEGEFQNFWRVYFIYLLNEYIFHSKEYSTQLRPARKHIDDFERLCEERGIPHLTRDTTLLTIVHKAFEALKSIRGIELTWKPDGAVGAGLKFDPARDDGPAAPNPLFINKLLTLVRTILQEAKLKVWIMLDRLDEVFPRRSAIETTALRSLLKCSNGFTDELLRLKIFLRDDIFESVTDTAEGFTALTHVSDRSSQRLTWTKDQILYLIVKRAVANKEISDFFKPDKNAMVQDPDYRKAFFYRLLPKQVRQGRNQPATLEWIYKRCEDGRGVVAPRDVIDLLRAAKAKQEELYLAQPIDQRLVLSAEAVQHGFIEMSKKKKSVFLDAEFKHVSNSVEAFVDGKAEHDPASLRRLLGDDWSPKVKMLESIGFIRRVARSGSYVIPFIYRPCLNLKQGKA